MYRTKPHFQRFGVAVSAYHLSYHYVLVQLSARVTAPGTQANATPNSHQISAWVQTATKDQLALAPVVACQKKLQPLSLAPLGQGATLNTRSQWTGLGQPGVCGESAARAVEGEDPEQGLDSAPHHQLGANHVMDQRMRQRPVSQNLAQVGQF